MAKTDDQPGTAVEKISEPGPLVLAVQGRGPLPPVDTQAMKDRINAQLLTAENPEQLIKGGSALGFDDLFGVPVEVHDFALLPSTYEGKGPKVFMVLEALRGDTGEQVVISTGAENVMMRLAIAKERGWLPLRFKVVKAERASTDGFYPYIVESV